MQDMRKCVTVCCTQLAIHPYVSDQDVIENCACRFADCSDKKLTLPTASSSRPHAKCQHWAAGIRAIESVCV